MNRIDVETDLFGQLMPWYREVLDYREICKTEEIQLRALEGALASVEKNFFFQTMDERAVAQWEQVFHISADPVGETLDFRRARLLNRVSTKPPFTLGFLYQKLDALFGAGNYRVEVDYPGYTLTVEAAAASQAWAGEIAVTIGAVKPCHMVYVSRPYVSATVLEAEEVSLARRQFYYRLGSWRLGEEPFADDTEMGVVKMPGQKSIEENLLGQTAGFLAQAAASARVNGSIAVSSLTKSAQGNTATVSYTVSQAQASTVTQVELLDAGGSVLTSAAVYVPVVEQAVFRHNFTVAEGEG